MSTVAIVLGSVSGGVAVIGILCVLAYILLGVQVGICTMIVCEIKFGPEMDMKTRILVVYFAVLFITSWPLVVLVAIGYVCMRVFGAMYRKIRPVSTDVCVGNDDNATNISINSINSIGIDVMKP